MALVRCLIMLLALTHVEFYLLTAEDILSTTKEDISSEDSDGQSSVETVDLSNEIKNSNSDSQPPFPSLEKPYIRRFISYLDGIISSMLSLKNRLFRQRHKSVHSEKMVPEQTAISDIFLKPSQSKTLLSDSAQPKEASTSPALSLLSNASITPNTSSAIFAGSVSNSSNSTGNSTTGDNFKFTCTQLKNSSFINITLDNSTNVTTPPENEVILLNSSSLGEYIRPTNSNLTKCTLVLFYVPW